MLRERDILNKNVVKADERTKKQIDLVKRQVCESCALAKAFDRSETGNPSDEHAEGYHPLEAGIAHLCCDELTTTFVPFVLPPAMGQKALF